MDNNRTYRIRTNVGEDKEVHLPISQDYDVLEILSLKIATENVYKLHASKYGCVVGRVLANGGVGVPNAKISIFIAADEGTKEDDILNFLYPYATTSSKNVDGIRYNLLPDEQVAQCHQQIGTFPNKRLTLDDKNTLEIFDTYYKYTTISNEAGDYMLFGVPTGNQSIHVDIDLSDIGFLSQKPIDMLYKGYNIEQFENAQQFKKDTNLANLSQVITQNTNVFVNSFWGDEGESEVSITRHDIDVDYKFEPTCIFMGSLVTDNSSNGFSKRCVPTPRMGNMEDLVTGSGTIEMIRKKQDGTVEEFSIKGTQLIDGNGTWCYQIPMNLDYVTTDEYGNLIPSDNPEKGIATRTRVRFRVSLSDFDSDYSNNHLVKVLVPNNPHIGETPDYVFGSETEDNLEGTKSFRDLLWNNVYTVKSFIPRIQKGNYQRTKKFSGIKNVNVHGQNSPIPYNNMRVNITFLFTLQCAIIKGLFRLANIYNNLLYSLSNINSSAKLFEDDNGESRCITFGDSLCPDAENWYFAPGCKNGANDKKGKKKFITRTLNKLKDDAGPVDTNSADATNNENEDTICLTTNGKYFMQCVEINLAMENNVIQFDFYNDWINGLLYIPRWFVKIRKKGSFLFGLIKIKPKIKACLEDSFKQTRKYTQQCALTYKATEGENNIFSTNVSAKGCKNDKKQKCHKTSGRKQVKIFGSKGGLVHNQKNMHNLSVYYAKPMEVYGDRKCNLFATDIVLLGSISNENVWGIPNDFDGMVSSTYQMPPNLVHTNMDSDGVLYGVSGGASYCTTVKRETLEKVAQTFEAYKTWTATEEFKPDDDVDEYAVTEMSGIDWGLEGPNQGSNDLDKLYFPGGHFLGIACANAEVNIKSCVNLSRMCEIGTSMSQRLSEVVEKAGGYGYEYVIPSGFISKLELTDANYRTIFATLNHNRLATNVNENGTRKYKFISVNPINYSGELSKVVDNDKYIAKRSDDELNGPYTTNAYVKTIEDNSRDYYYFRLGINDENPTAVSKNEVKRRYLIQNSDGTVTLPVYENSYYFYFGLKDGSTAINKFMSDYYAQCPTDEIVVNPSIKSVVINSQLEICGESPTVTINMENMLDMIPYSVTIVTPNQTLVKVGGKHIETSTITLSNEYFTEGGNYEIMLKNEEKGISISKEFYIDEILSSDEKHNFFNGSCVVATEDMLLTNTVKIEGLINKEMTIVSPFYDTLNEVETQSNGGFIYINAPRYNINKQKPYIIGLIISNGGYSIYHSLCGTDKSTVIDKFVKDYENRIKHTLVVPSDDIINENEGEDTSNIRVKAWYSGEYTIKVVYSCNRLGVSDSEFELGLGVYEIDNVIVNTQITPYTYYIFDETLSFEKLSNNNVFAMQGISEKTYTKEIEGYVGKFSSTYTKGGTIPNWCDLNDEYVWKLKKSLIFDVSKYNGETKNIILGTVNGTTPLTTKKMGTKTIQSIVDGKYQLTDVDGTTDEKSIDYSSIVLPTEGWTMGENEFKEITLLLNKTKDISYYITETDGDGFAPLFGKKPTVAWKDIDTFVGDEETEIPDWIEDDEDVLCIADEDECWEEIFGCPYEENECILESDCDEDWCPYDDCHQDVCPDGPDCGEDCDGPDCEPEDPDCDCDEEYPDCNCEVEYDCYPEDPDCFQDCTDCGGE